MNSSPHGGKAARDALERLALSLDAGAFVDVDARAVHLRRTRDDAVGECLRNYQLCASAKLSRDANLRSVLTPIVRWTVCARLLDVVGRAVDGGVEKDVRAAVAAVAAAADARDDDDAHHLSLPATGGSIPDELFSRPGPLRTPASRTDTTRALVEDIDRIVTELAETMLGGWKGTPIVRNQREDPRGSISADGKDADVSLTAHTREDLLDIEFIHSAAAAAEDFAERLVDDVPLTMRECVDHLLTPVAIALANAAARRATRTIDGPSSSTSKEIRNAWIDLPPRCAVAAADCCERVHSIATDLARRENNKNENTAVFGFGIASLTGVDIFPGGGGGDRSSDVNSQLMISSREVAASSGLGAAALRKACAEGIVAAELLAAQRTSYAAAVADAAKRGLPGLTPIRSNPRTTKRDGNEKEVRYAATDAVRRCETAQLCRRTLANARIAHALSPMETTKDKGSRGRHEAHVYTGSIGGSIVEGSQVAKDFTREGSGLAIAVGLDAPFETVATGPFHAHFVAACGAVERALRSSGTLQTSTKDSESKDFIQSSSLNSKTEKKSRWMSPPTSPAKKKRTIDASDDVDRCSAAAAARVMLAASRTVRAGDALEFVLTMFPPEDDFVVVGVQPTDVAKFYEIPATYRPVEVVVTRDFVTVSLFVLFSNCLPIRTLCVLRSRRGTVFTSAG